MCPGVEARFNVAPPAYVCDKPYPVATPSPDGGWTLDANKKGVGLLSGKHQAQSGQPLPEATPAGSQAKPSLDLLLGGWQCLCLVPGGSGQHLCWGSRWREGSGAAAAVGLEGGPFQAAAF